MGLPVTTVSNVVALAFSLACTLMGITAYIIERQRQSSGEQQIAVDRRLTAVRTFLVVLLPPSVGLLAHSELYLVPFYSFRPGAARDDFEAVNVWVSFTFAVFTKLLL